MHFQDKEIVITRHAVERARMRGIHYPDQIYNVIITGKLARFGKQMLKFMKKGKVGSVICICEEIQDKIIVKTVERGN